MRAYSLAHLSDEDLLSDLEASIAKASSATVEVLVRIAEVDTRRLYLPAGYPSMYAYCVDKLHLSEDAAYKRIQAARTARRFPILFSALAEGRLHLTAVCLLRPRLTEENVEELVAAATHRRKSEIEQLLAQRFPRVERPTVDPAITSLSNAQLVPEPVGSDVSDAGTRSTQLVPEPVGAMVRRPRVAPVAPQRFALQVTIDQETYELLQYAQALLGHSLPSGDVAQVLKRSLALLIHHLEKSKFAATSRPRQCGGRPGRSKRHIPAHVRRAVWQRDAGQCTFEGPHGHRCGARKFLEFDHMDPVARGGQATVERMRLRCRAHNQFEAERTFGAGFMKKKREEARRKTSEARARADQNQADVLAGLRGLGVRGDIARRATEFSASLANATLEDRMRAALRFLGPRMARAVTNGGPPI